MRTFIALELPEEHKTRVAEIIKSLKNAPGGRYVRWVRTEGMHLTLKFLGEIDQQSISVIAEGIIAATKNQRQIQLRLSELGCFPNPSNPRVLWLGVKGDTQMLTQLQSRIDRELHQRGFNKEPRPYHPHLTLGRLRKDVPKVEYQQVAKLLEAGKPDLDTFLIDEVILFESLLRPEGAVHKPLVRTPLGDGI